MRILQLGIKGGAAHLYRHFKPTQCKFKVIVGYYYIKKRDI